MYKRETYVLQSKVHLIHSSQPLVNIKLALQYLLICFFLICFFFGVKSSSSKPPSTTQNYQWRWIKVKNLIVSLNKQEHLNLLSTAWYIWRQVLGFKTFFTGWLKLCCGVGTWKWWIKKLGPPPSQRSTTYLYKIGL